MYIFNIKISLKCGIYITCTLLNVLDRLSIFGLKESTLINKYEDVQIAYTTAISVRLTLKRKHQYDLMFLVTSIFFLLFWYAHETVVSYKT